MTNGRHVLIIEDEAPLRERLARILGFEGFRVTTAADGREGIEAARSDRPQLVICDLLMPGINGFGVCRALRDDPRTSDVPVVVLSALSAASDRERVASLGAVHYLTKPFRTSELLEVVRACLGPAA